VLYEIADARGRKIGEKLKRIVTIFVKRKSVHKEFIDD